MKVKCPVCGWRYDPATHPLGDSFRPNSVPNHFPLCCPGMGERPVRANDQGPIRKTWEPDTEATAPATDARTLDVRG